MDTFNQVAAAAIQVLALMAAVGVLILVLAAEAWVARNMIRGWKGSPGWRGMMNAAADMTHPHGDLDAELAQQGARRT